MGGNTTLYAFDAAYPKTASTYRAYGGVAANVYVSGNYAQDAAHVASLRAGGIAPWPNYEVGLWELVSNRAAGRAAARRGIADAKRCGFPANGTIWFPFSVDVNVNPSQYGQVGAAFDGINDVNAGQYLISCYGQGGLIDYLRATGRIRTKGWLSGSSSFPGFNPGSPNICLVQEVGSPIPGTDRNIITDPAALRAWWPNGEAPLGSGTPLGGFMTQLTDAQQVELYNNVKAMRGFIDALDNTVGYPSTAAALSSVPGNVRSLTGLPAAVANVPTNDELAGLVWNQPIKVGATTLTAAQWLSRTQSATVTLDTATLDALAVAVASHVQTVDPAAIRTALDAALTGLTLTGTTTVSKAA